MHIGVTLSETQQVLHMITIIIAIMITIIEVINVRMTGEARKRLE